MNNHTIYANDELDSWTKRSELLEEEAYMIKKYIQNRGKLIEAGTGGGRIAIWIKKEFPKIDIYAFDFVKKMIESAKIKSEDIRFDVADATNLDYLSSESFDYAIYLQQIVSLVPHASIETVLSEVFRILKNDGVVLFSFLYYPARKINPFLSFFVNITRLFRGQKWQKQKLPWLRLGGKPNYHIFGKNQATTYWFELDEIKDILTEIGFKLLEIKTTKEIIKQSGSSKGMLYVACKK